MIATPTATVSPDRYQRWLSSETNLQAGVR